MDTFGALTLAFNYSKILALVTHYTNIQIENKYFFFLVDKLDIKQISCSL